MGIVCCRCPTFITILSLLQLSLLVDAFLLKSSRQYLPPVPGYIPVYIQDGDTPPDVESIVNKHSIDSVEMVKDSSDDSNERLDLARNVDETLKESKAEIMQQLIKSPEQNAQHARLYFNLPAFKHNMMNSQDLFNRVSRQQNIVGKNS